MGCALVLKIMLVLLPRPRVILVINMKAITFLLSVRRLLTLVKWLKFVDLPHLDDNFNWYERN